MKSSIEIGMTINKKGWTIRQLADALKLPENWIKVAIQSKYAKDVRRQIADAIGIGYSELFGEDVND